jgi:LacI family transcriptional regulator
MAALARWVGALPKPCGIFAANDIRAKEVMDACAAASVSVPGQVLVLGVDDEEFVCRQMRPTLSSVVPDFDKGGYLAAEMLVELLSGGPRRIGRRLFGVRGIVERLSTSDPNEAGRMVERAEEFIREHATSADISVRDVAKASAASLRLLQKNFKFITGTTVCEAIQTARLQRACSLLTETRTPIGRIAELCGFGGDAYLKKLFRNRLGCTMRDYRHREAPCLMP